MKRRAVMNILERQPVEEAGLFEESDYLESILRVSENERASTSLGVH